MAFSLLNGGPDCAVGVNPLHQALKATSHDASLQRDVNQPLAGPSSSIRRTHSPTPEARAEEERFYRAAGGIPFDLQSLRQTLPVSQPQTYSPDPAFSAAYADMSMTAADASWAQDFKVVNQHPNSAIPATNGPIYGAPTYSRPSASLGMYRSAFAGSGFATPRLMQHFEGKGKHKVDESRFVELADDKAWNEAFDKMAAPPQQLKDAEPILDPQQEDDPLTEKLDAEWRRLQGNLNSYADMDKEMAEWEAQYGSQFVNQDGDYSFHQPEAFNFEELTKNPPEWEFAKEEENGYKDHPDPFAEGKRLLAAGAPFIEVEGAFEEACKRDQTRGEAWSALGETLAADEKELLAIKALERAISVPSGEGSESAWLALAISYINEGMDTKALGVLEEWLKRTYPQIASKAPPPIDTTAEDGTFNPWANQQRIIDMYLAAARAGPVARSRTLSALNEQVDADVQIGLGVLFYGNSDYTLAKDCFEAALSVKPEDYILWNRLGATLANGGHPEDAISAYRTALSIRPNFTRSLYNLGVSCLNINCFQEAAEHLLAALELQGTAGKGEESDGLWQTLRRTFVCMERPDLAEKARAQADLNVFRSEFNF